MRKAHNQFKETLLALETAPGTKVFQTVALDSGQMERLLGRDENTQGIVLFPAVFIRYANIRYDHQTEGRRRGYAEMICTLVMRDEYGVEDNDIFSLREKLDAGIMDARYKNEHMVQMDMTGEDMPPSYDNIVMWRMRYQFAFDESEVTWKYRNGVEFYLEPIVE